MSTLAPAAPRRLPLVAQWVIGALVSLGLLLGGYRHLVPLNMFEVWGFLTGALSVWLAAKNHVVNWSVGIINSFLYIYVFFQARLFADAGLQVFFIVTSVLGWYWWTKGRDGLFGLTITHVTLRTALATTGLTALSTLALWVFLRHVRDVAPFWDALITVLSIAATYLMARRLIECWWVWITVDVISITLYAVKGLPLTAILYAIFLAMCVVGVVGWLREYSDIRE